MTKEKQKVWLTIKGSLDSDQASDEISDFSTEGYYYRDGETHCFTYHESEVSGMGNTMTTVRVEGKKVSVIRLGDVNSVMDFETGQQKMHMYETPYGDLSMRLFTRDVAFAYDDNARINRLTVDYDLEVVGLISGSNVIEIIVNY